MQSGAVIGQCDLQVIYKFACSAGSDAERKRRNSFGAKRHKCQCFSAAPQTCSGEKVFNPNISSAVPQACAAKRAPTYSERLDKLRIFADEAAEELPQVFYRELNGGIILSPITKAHPQSDPKKPLLVLGEYRNSPQMGRSIVLYGGSILRSYGNLPDEKLKAEVRHILRHEFTHHLESLSGTNDLEIDDAVKLNRYKASIHAE